MRLFTHGDPRVTEPSTAPHAGDRTIHLDRNVNGEGLKLNPQHHLDPVWGLGS